jgi:SAM-dependent methyltransferase
MSEARDRAFHESIAEIYARDLVPLIFEPYAEDLARRVPPDVRWLLEIAAGTGVLTRALDRVLPPSVAMVASDLNPAMLATAQSQQMARPVEWKQADALALPFDDAAFDAVVCQFGVMFFPDRVRGYAEIRRVLRAGGMFLFNVWDRIEDNEFADVIADALVAMHPSDPPLFMRRVPHGYFDVQLLRQDLRAAGFTAAPTIETVTRRSHGVSARNVAVAFCQGTPTRNELEARGISLDEASDVATNALTAAFGRDAIEGKIQAIVVTVRK